MHDIRYVSPLTRLLQDVIAADPAIEESQRRGRAMFWDKKLDFEQQRRLAETELPQLGYPYAAYLPQPKPKMAEHPVLPATE